MKPGRIATKEADAVAAAILETVDPAVIWPLLPYQPLLASAIIHFGNSLLRVRECAGIQEPWEEQMGDAALIEFEGAPLRVGDKLWSWTRPGKRPDNRIVWEVTHVGLLKVHAGEIGFVANSGAHVGSDEHTEFLASDLKTPGLFERVK